MFGAVELSHPGDVVWGQMIEIADARFHKRLSGRSIRDMTQTEDVSKFMHENPMNISGCGLQWAAVGIVMEGGVADNVGLGHDRSPRL